MPTSVVDFARPRFPSGWLGLLLIIIVTSTLIGCKSNPYIPVPACTVVLPPDPSQYLDAMPDERLVMMSSTYIAQVKEVALCNNQIEQVNIANKAKSQ